MKGSAVKAKAKPLQIALPRHSVRWIMASVFMAVVPHMIRLPWWLTAAVVFALLWQLQVFRQRWSMPGWFVRLILVISGCYGIYFTYGTIIGPDAGVSLLVLAYVFKLLEMRTVRDAYLIVILSYFIVATEYLFSRNLLVSLYSFVVIGAITATLVALNQRGPDTRMRHTGKVAFRLLLHSLPMMIVLFFMVPRFAPLWSMGVDVKKARTGMSDSMTLGDLSELSLSSALAFRAELLEGQLPAPASLYWRGAVFSNFDGQSWKVDLDAVKSLDRDATLKALSRGTLSKVVDANGGDRLLKYRVFLEPTQFRWIYTLPLSSVDTKGYTLATDFTWRSSDPIINAIHYDARYLGSPESNRSGLTDHLRQLYLQLPKKGNPRTRRWAQQLVAAHNYRAAPTVEAVLAYYKQRNFHYTLRPTPVTVNPIDEFLFTTQNGFCLHYAGATVFALRAAGIPARMIGGYQGGELHESGAYVSVREYMAHAWIEYWEPNRGWQRVDPTAAVAPERIDQGVRSLLRDDSYRASSPLNPGHMRNWPLFSQLRQSFEHLDYLWNRFVVGYDRSAQFKLFENLLGQFSWVKVIWALLIAVLTTLLLIAGWLWWRQPKTVSDPVDLLYHRFCRRLEKQGITRLPSEPPYAFSQRVAQERPDLALLVADITDRYVALRFAPPMDNHATLQRSFQEYRRLVLRSRLRR